MKAIVSKLTSGDSLSVDVSEDFRSRTFTSGCRRAIVCCHSTRSSSASTSTFRLHNFPNYMYECMKKQVRDCLRAILLREFSGCRVDLPLLRLASRSRRTDAACLRCLLLPGLSGFVFAAFVGLIPVRAGKEVISQRSIAERDETGEDATTDGLQPVFVVNCVSRLIGG